MTNLLLISFGKYVFDGVDGFVLYTLEKDDTHPQRRLFIYKLDITTHLNCLQFLYNSIFFGRKCHHEEFDWFNLNS